MNSPYNAIAEDAAAWFARRRDGASDDDAAFEAWRQRSAVHARTYVEIEREWEGWKELRDSARLRAMSAAAMKATAPGRRQSTGRRWLPLLAAASLAAVAVLGGLWLTPLLLPAPLVTYSTGVGEQKTEHLSDGTRIVLNTQTTLQVRYESHRREVILKHGEALFDVAHDPNRPFAVLASNGRITDLGTEFLVKDEGGAALVTLLQGAVEVVTKTTTKQLIPGEQALYGPAIRGVRVHSIDTSNVTSWTHGRLDFTDWPLARVVAEANRYSTVKLRLGDGRLAKLSVSGTLRTGNNLAIANALSAVLPLQVARRGAREVVLMPH